MDDGPSIVLDVEMEEEAGGRANCRLPSSTRRDGGGCCCCCCSIDSILLTVLIAGLIIHTQWRVAAVLQLALQRYDQTMYERMPHMRNSTTWENVDRVIMMLTRKER